MSYNQLYSATGRSTLRARLLLDVQSSTCPPADRSFPFGRAHAEHRHALRPLPPQETPNHGHLFERRYRARLFETDDYFLAVLRYIHLNPVAARIVTDPARYPWSSHRAYLGTDTPGWITTEFGLSLFSSDPQQARIS
jgi:hypothetical protein